MLLKIPDIFYILSQINFHFCLDKNRLNISVFSTAAPVKTSHAPTNRTTFGRSHGHTVSEVVVFLDASQRTVQRVYKHGNLWPRNTTAALWSGKILNERDRR